LEISICGEIKFTVKHMLKVAFLISTVKLLMIRCASCLRKRQSR